MPTPEINDVTTPFYLYDLDLLDRTLAVAASEASRYGFHIHYATKANYDLRVLDRVRKAGFGADCVSGNEVQLALDQGFSPAGIVLAGVGKTDREIEDALRNRILCLNVESVEELEVVGMIASRLKLQAPVALRVNPDIPALTHHHITTGLRENKFGIPLERLQEALDLCREHPWINFLGLHFHIGSQITSLHPFEALCIAASRIWHDFAISDYGGTMVNLGGGLGIDYQDPENNPIPDFRRFFRLVREKLDMPANISRHFELGRSLVGQCGSIVTRVLYVKQGTEKKHVIVDAGMTELIRPALYGAVHKIGNMTSHDFSDPFDFAFTGDSAKKYDVVGPICESSDRFGKDVILPETVRGDLLKIHSCGAYAESMGMNYNLRGPIGKVYNNSGFVNENLRSVHDSYCLMTFPVSDFPSDVRRMK